MYTASIPLGPKDDLLNELFWRELFTHVTSTHNYWCAETKDDFCIKIEFYSRMIDLVHQHGCRDNTLKIMLYMLVWLFHFWSVNKGERT